MNRPLALGTRVFAARIISSSAHGVLPVPTFTRGSVIRRGQVEGMVWVNWDGFGERVSYSDHVQICAEEGSRA